MEMRTMSNEQINDAARMVTRICLHPAWLVIGVFNFLASFVQQDLIGLGITVFWIALIWNRKRLIGD
jgi:hypothetical protein